MCLNWMTLSMGIAITCESKWPNIFRIMLTNLWQLCLADFLVKVWLNSIWTGIRSKYEFLRVFHEVELRHQEHRFWQPKCQKISSHPKFGCHENAGKGFACHFCCHFYVLIFFVIHFKSSIEEYHRFRSSLCNKLYLCTIKNLCLPAMV